MKILIGLIVVFLAIVYIYTFLKIRKKRKNKTPDAVQSFHQKYDRVRSKSNRANQSSRYNSVVDYITREELTEDKNGK